MIMIMMTQERQTANGMEKDCPGMYFMCTCLDCSPKCRWMCLESEEEEESGKTHMPGRRITHSQFGHSNCSPTKCRPSLYVCRPDCFAKNGFICDSCKTRFPGAPPHDFYDRPFPCNPYRFLKVCGPCFDAKINQHKQWM